MATMFGGVTDLHYTSFCGEDQRISTEGKIFSKYCNRSKTLRREGGHQPPPAPLYHGGGMTLHVCPRIKYDSLSS